MDNDKVMMYTGIACQVIAILACWTGQMQYVYGVMLNIYGFFNWKRKDGD